MTLKTDSPFEADPPVFLLKDLTTRSLEKHEHALAEQFFEQQHYFDDCPFGRQLLQVVEYQGTGWRYWTGVPAAGSLPTARLISGGRTNNAPSASAWWCKIAVF